MQHYYTNDPDLAHDESQFDFDLAGRTLHFTTDNGVFSKRTIDYGSRVLIDAVIGESLPAGNILDVGTGYGPIGLALASHYPDRTVVMSDVNERALALAKRNAEANQISNVEILESAAYEAITGQYGVVVTNPPIRAGKDVVSAIIAGAADFLTPGGQLYVVIQKKQGAPSALKLMQATYADAEILKKDRGYYILKAEQAQ
ncbi:class I SAM-dependent methyltransferase [Lacticaseibacillus brantae]|uniref:16S rRNA m(2)G 1207 methyltransferase n=1 Tax=Lacticaseibacillus brantae DSM 23927 TaxID=1423727 RepID=A0A0R2AW75_9LACO|nr:class I SAM-dependent methyltransferase [Lacticaseibacillus brantae]KRM71501.1 16S rRNA m(2)G 1207 methyltransferase [Lacticaseibacillus brantae DSM 23927]